jgi:hypothetical protein
VVYDAKTGEYMPYASIGLKNFSIGTISNEKGEFEFYVPASSLNDTLVIAYVGYKSFEVPLKKAGEKIKVTLQPVAIAIDELYVYPLSPEEYIKRAMRRVKENYALHPFRTMAYFQEEVRENGQLITGGEAIVKSYYPEYSDTVRNQHQLLLYRETEEIHELSFMKDWRDKAERKEKKKALRKGEEADPEEDDKNFMGLGGPETLLHFSILKQSDAFLDSNNFNRFTYLFGEGRFYRGKNLISIHFNARRAVDNFKENGTIFIDPDSYAIVFIESNGRAIIPVAVRPILLALGLGLRDPVFNRTIKYEPYKGTYYPKDFHWNASVHLTKRHVFKKDEHSHIEAGQLFLINEVNTEKAIPIPEEYLFDPKKKMEEQVHNEDNVSWEGMNILKK